MLSPVVWATWEISLAFHPISLTSFNYKIISKILSNRFKPLLHKIVSPAQPAFLKSRSIHDNTILTHELFHLMKQKKGNGGLMALKLEIEKAFDSMELEFFAENSFFAWFTFYLDSVDSTMHFHHFILYSSW